MNPTSSTLERFNDRLAPYGLGADMTFEGYQDQWSVYRTSGAGMWSWKHLGFLPPVGDVDQLMSWVIENGWTAQ